MYEPKLWQDHVTEFEDRYTESRNDDGTITHTPVEGEIIQQERRRTQPTSITWREFQMRRKQRRFALATIHQQQATADLQGETKR